MRSKNLFNKVYNILVFAISIIAIIMLIFEDSSEAYGYDFLFVVPLGYTLFYLTGKFKYLYNNIPIIEFKILTFLRYSILPLLMALSNNYSGSFYQFTVKTTENERIIATILYFVEMVGVMIIANIESSRMIRSDMYNLGSLKWNNYSIVSHSYNNVVLWLSILVGIVGFVIYPAIRNRMFFFSVGLDVESAPMSFIPTAFFEFTKLIPILLIIIAYRNIIRTRKLQLKNSTTLNILLLMLASILSIGIRWNNNRMSIVRSVLICLVFWFLLFPRKKKQIVVLLGSLAVVALICVTSFKWFGQTQGNIDLSVYSSTFDLSEATKYIQMYFNGVDELAYAVKLKTSVDINLRTFINDTFRNTLFLNQLVRYGDTVNTSQLFNACVNGYRNVGLIIPMSGQALMHLGYLFSSLYSCICTKLLFTSVKQANRAISFSSYLFWTLLALEFGGFQGYNYSLIIGNIWNNVILLSLLLKLADKFVIRRN